MQTARHTERLTIRWTKANSGRLEMRWKATPTSNDNVRSFAAPAALSTLDTREAA